MIGFAITIIVDENFNSPLLEERASVIAESLLGNSDPGFHPMLGCQIQTLCMRQLKQKFHECIYICMFRRVSLGTTRTLSNLFHLFNKIDEDEHVLF